MKVLCVQRETCTLLEAQQVKCAWGFTAAGDVPSPLCSLLNGKASHLPVAFASGWHHLLDYGGCHLSSLSLTVKDSPARGGFGMVKKQLAGLAGFLKWESPFLFFSF